MKIYLVRHGQTDWNYQKKIQGQQDVDINEQGRKTGGDIEKCPL